MLSLKLFFDFYSIFFLFSSIFNSTNANFTKLSITKSVYASRLDINSFKTQIPIPISIKPRPSSFPFSLGLNHLPHSPLTPIQDQSPTITPPSSRSSSQPGSSSSRSMSHQTITTTLSVPPSSPPPQILNHPTSDLNPAPLSASLITPRGLPAEIFIIVRPPPGKANHFLNLQVQLVLPTLPVNNPQSGQSDPSMHRTPSVRSGHSARSNRSLTSLVSSETSRSGRRVTPLYNLQWHTVLPTWISDAGPFFFSFFFLSLWFDHTQFPKKIK